MTIGTWLCRTIGVGCVLGIVSLAGDGQSVRGAEPPPVPEVQLHKTSSGIPFATLGGKPAHPAPTLFIFGADMRSSLTNPDVNRLGRLLIPHGYLCVSMDIPAHGTDARPGERPGDLAEWKARIMQGENIASKFNEQVSAVLNELIAEKYSDPGEITVSGTSRGGFLAFHAGAAEPRFKRVIAFAPVTHLPALTEFAGAEENALACSLHPKHLADKLVGKPLWIVIGNDDDRVSSQDCLAFALEVIKKSKGKLNPIPVEMRLVGTIGHRLHAVPTPQYSQFCSPHDEAATWLLAQRMERR